MDPATAQQLAAGIQALAAAAAALPPPPAPPAPAAPAADPLNSPYEGGPLDLASRHGSSLFRDGAQALASKFTGKVNALQLFLADLKTRAKTCRCDHPTHGILTAVAAGTKYNLLDDYGKITDAQVEAARVARNAADASPRAKQNSQMMYECLMASITEEAKSALASRNQEFHEDGPSLFHHVVSQLFTATFSNAQATRDNLADFHLKWFRYDVIQVNNYISSAVMTLKAASSAGGTITDQDILYFQFKVYKKIKAPAEWTAHIQFLESTVASTPGYTPKTLFNETQAKYTTLLNQGLWKPSDKTPEKQTLAMVAQQQQAKKSSNNSTKSKPSSGQSSKNTEKDKKNPPFANSPGKLGDTKQWNGKTYYWFPANHKHSHWHTHKVEECNTYKKMIKEKNNANNDDQKKVTVDEDNLKKGMAAIFPLATSTPTTWQTLSRQPLQVWNDCYSCGFGGRLQW